MSSAAKHTERLENPSSNKDGARAEAGSLLAKLSGWNWWFAGLLVAAIFIVYLPGIHGSFVWDDDAWTTKITSLLRDGAGLWRMWTKPGALQQFFPLSGTTFWLDYHLWGTNTLPYHVENVVIHAGATLLFWRLLLRFKVPGAWLAAALFGLHPVMVESAGWIAERKNVLSMVLFLGTLLAYGRFTGFWEEERPEPGPGRKGHWTAYGLALLLFVAALLAKTTTITLPAVLLVLCWWKRGRIRLREDVVPTLPFFAIAIGLGLATMWVEKNSLGAKGPEWALSLSQRCLIAGRAVWFYATELVWPANLCFVYPRWTLDARSLWQWLYPVSAAGTLLGLWLARGRLGRGPAAAAFFFSGTLFPVLGFFNVYFMRYSFVSDHWSYISSLSLLALGAALVMRAAEHFRAPALIYGFAGVVLPVFAALTWQQSGMYKDLETLYATTLARNPGCVMAHNNLGMMLVQKGRNEEAASHFQKAVELDPKHASAHNNLALILLKAGQIEAAKFHFQQALASDPGYGKAESNLGMIFLQQDKLTEAKAHFQRALELIPNLSEARLNLANALSRLGERQAAIGQLQKLLETQPNNAYALISLAMLLATAPEANLRNGKLAVQLAEKANQISNGRVPMFRVALAEAYAEAGRFPDAIATAEPVLQWATAQHDTGAEKMLRKQLELYRAGSAYHESASPGAPATGTPK
jgi:tetratricopeptide (TPR) repeat protein